jgi:hypothetical protein
MKRLVLPLALLFTLLCGFTLAWKEFRSVEGNFSVSMPGEVEVESQEIESEVGALPTYTFTATEKTAAYVVAYTDYPADSIGDVDPAAILDGARDGVQESLNGTIVRERNITISGHPGRDLEMKSGEMQVRSNIYLVGSRMYQVIAVVPTKGKMPKSVEKFLASFKLLKKG